MSGAGTKKPQAYSVLIVLFFCSAWPIVQRDMRRHFTVLERQLQCRRHLVGWIHSEMAVGTDVRCIHRQNAAVFTADDVGLVPGMRECDVCHSGEEKDPSRGFISMTTPKKRKERENQYLLCCWGIMLSAVELSGHDRNGRVCGRVQSANISDRRPGNTGLGGSAVLNPEVRDQHCKIEMLLAAVRAVMLRDDGSVY